MTERTFNIIMACKNANRYNVCDSVKEYMSQECDCEIEVYSEVTLARIMLEAMYDYLDSCDKPSVFMREFNDIYYLEQLSTAEHIARTFSLVQVRDDGVPINGFGEWMK